MVDMSKMMTVYMGLFKRGPRAAEWDARPNALSQLQAARLATIRGRTNEIQADIVGRPEIGCSLE